MSQVRYSAHAAAIYLAAQGGEFLALCAYAIETQGLDKRSRGEYNHLVSDQLNLSLKTMQNRASIALKIQDKYGVQLAAYLECNEENVRSLSHFLQGEMDKTGNKYQRHTNDVGRFLDGKISERMEKEQAAQRAADAAKARQEARLAADKRQAEDVAKREADMSGAPTEPSNAAVPAASTTVGNADQSENRGDSKPSVVPMEEKRAKILLVVEEDDAGDMSLEGVEDMTTEQLEAIVKYLSGELVARKGAEVKAA